MSERNERGETGSHDVDSRVRGSTIAIIVAAGRGRRMGAERPKAFLSIGGELLVIRALRPFEACADVDGIVLVVPESERAVAEAAIRAAGLVKIQAVIGGGPERAHSVFRALEVIPRSEAEIIVVHDGVRPFITPEEIARVIERARRGGAALYAVPIAETVKEVEGDRVVRTVDRRRLYVAQTPQAFRAEILRAAYERGMREGLVMTDDAALVEHYGGIVSVLEGSRRNLKITWPEDVIVAEALVRAEEGR